MKILIHTGISYPDGDPCKKRMGIFYEELLKSGHSVIILAPKMPEGMPLDPDTVYCSCVPLRKKNNIYRLLNSLSFAFVSIFKSFCIRKVDVVITTSPPPLISISAWIIAKIKHSKLVYDVRDIWPDVALEMGSFSNNSLYSRVFSFIRNFMLKHSDLITTVSPGKVKKLQQYCPYAKIIEVGNGLDKHFLDNKDDLEFAAKYDFANGFICSYIGNLGLAQGCSQLVNLAERTYMQNLSVRFMIFGSGASEKQLRQDVEKKHLNNIVFCGRVPNRQVYTILKHSEISFISLVNENLRDSIPTKMYEALGVGCPVLLAACGDSVDILNECKLGMAVKPNDSEALWNTFYSMYKNIEEIKANAEYAKSIILSKYSRQDAVQKMEMELRLMIEN